MEYLINSDISYLQMRKNIADYDCLPSNDSDCSSILNLGCLLETVLPRWIYLSECSCYWILIFLVNAGSSMATLHDLEMLHNILMSLYFLHPDHSPDLNDSNWLFYFLAVIDDGRDFACFCDKCSRPDGYVLVWSLVDLTY